MSEWMQTASGKVFYPLAPRAEDIDVRDIAHHLSNQCRFGGAVREFYSVAQHSVYVSHHVSPENAYVGLMHDWPEAYITDLPRPIKHHAILLPYRIAEQELWRIGFSVLGLPCTVPEEVKLADKRMAVTEHRDLMAYASGWGNGTLPFEFTVEPLPPEEARREFIQRYEQLTGKVP